VNAAKRKRKSKPGRLGATLMPLFGQTGRRIWIGVFLAVGLLGGTYYGWQQWGSEISRSPEYQVRAENIEITPLPPWIHSDVKAEALRDGSLTDLSLLDRQLAVKIARAFSMHTWVQDVRRVSKQTATNSPTRVVVELVYRKPVAMVEVVIQGRGGLLPIDANGYLLPTSDFSAEQATRGYLRISIPNAMPAGQVGTAWGDPRVHGAARIAALLDGHWKKLGLYRIGIIPPKDSSSSPETKYMLLTREGTQIVWGKAPDAKNPADVKIAQQKVAHLLAYVQSHGPLDSADQSEEINLTGRAVDDPRTASTQTPPY